jgi:transcriptional/translational regulatory protein YebC/TACO1
MKSFLLLLTLLLSASDAFQKPIPPPGHRVPAAGGELTSPCPGRVLGPLFMGRAAAVRANTKSKTDAAKAKTNGFYGKKLIMAVKQGGSPDPEANTMLRDVIKAAKSNNVPVDVSDLW